MAALIQICWASIAGGAVIRYKKGLAIRYIGPKFRDFFL